MAAISVGVTPALPGVNAYIPISLPKTSILILATDPRSVLGAHRKILPIVIATVRTVTRRGLHGGLRCAEKSVQASRFRYVHLTLFTPNGHLRQNENCCYHWLDEETENLTVWGIISHLRQRSSVIVMTLSRCCVTSVNKRNDNCLK